MRIRWFVTDLPFIEGESIINNRIFDAQNWLDRPIGEVPLWRRQWKQRTFRDRVLGVNGKHQCHPEWIATGEPWPVTLPDTVYNPNGIPTCCGLNQNPVRLPIDIGFRIGVHYCPPRSVRLPTSVGFRVGVRYSAPIPVRVPMSVGFRIGVTYTPPPSVRVPADVGFRIGVTYTSESGTWERTACGDYAFTASFTGDHLVRLYGAAGVGGDATGGGGMGESGGGGGGGAEVRHTLALVSGMTYFVSVGCGGTPVTVDGGDTVIEGEPGEGATAKGGKGAVGAAGGAGGSALDSSGDQKWSGGSGVDGGPGDPGGGGGSSACDSPTGMPPGTGTDGVGSLGGIPPLGDGGPGGDGGAAGDGGTAGGGPGGGGGGAGDGAADPGGDGHDGRIIIIWPAP